MGLEYRKDIDGLRAIAVIAVILNHAGFSAFPGGYIGVDIFFVISGFLITSIISREIVENKFTILKFYERRIRRILPALTGMAFFVILASFVMYDLEKLKAVGKSLAATMLFFSNINFWKEAGYFDAPSQLKPLLHTWSLAVEEQFYIVFPLLIFFLNRYAQKTTKYILLAIALISFGYAAYEINQDPAKVFYLSQFRAWELLVGCLLSLQLLPFSISKIVNNLLSLLGILMISIPIFVFTANTQFPGPSAAIPVIGTALIIYSNHKEQTIVGHIIGISPLVFIGKISYSLYLWHWPLILFTKYFLIRPINQSEKFYILGLTFIISVLSWRLIETPFRSKNFLKIRQVYAFAAVTMAALLFTAGSAYYFEKFSNRLGFGQQDQKKSDDHWAFKDCNINIVDNPESIQTCELGVSSALPSFFVWGDSHAPTFGKPIDAVSSEYGLRGILSYSNGCPPLLDMIAHPSVGDFPCQQYNNMVIQYLMDHPEIKTVIIASRLTPWVEESHYKMEEGGRLYLTDDQKVIPDGAPGEQLVQTGLERTIRAIQALNRKVVIIVPIPEIGFDVPSANYIATRTGRDENTIIAPTIDEYLARNQKTMSVLNTIKEKYNVQMIEPWRVLCNGNLCRASIDHIPLYKDDDHLSIFGSEIVTPAFNELFSSMAQQGN